MTTADRVLDAVREVHTRDGRATIRSIAQAAGLSLRPTHTHLRALRDAGLVIFADGKSGTIRPVTGPPATAAERWPQLPSAWEAARAADAAVNGATP